MTSAMNWLATWASSPGGPDRNLQEHRGDRSTLGTERNTSCEPNFTSGLVLKPLSTAKASGKHYITHQLHSFPFLMKILSLDKSYIF